MRSAPASLTGVTLGFDRAGARLIVGEPDAIAVVEIATGKTRRLPYTHARAVAGVCDQVWVAAHPRQIVRAAPLGRPARRAPPLSLFCRGGVTPAPRGAAG